MPRLLLIALIALAATTGCRDDGGEALCPAGSACATPCASDAECAAGQRCNATGRCQVRDPCRANADCGADETCDATSARCVPSATCLRDLHCPFGERCADGVCEPGCTNDGDCPLYDACVDGACEERCRTNDFCDYGAVCANGTCYPSPNPSHCARCDVDRECPYPGTDYCLLNHAYDRNQPEYGPPRYCGVECGDDPSKCPNGYVCEAVVRLTQDACEQDIHCGRLDRECVIAEGEARGFCSCANDLDCLPEALTPHCRLGFCEAPAGRLCGSDDDCDPLRVCDRHGGAPRDICVTDGSFCDSAEDCLCDQGRCINTGRPCSAGADCRLSCVQGLCFVGAACTPAEGLYCPDLVPMSR